MSGDESIGKCPCGGDIVPMDARWAKCSDCGDDTFPLTWPGAVGGTCQQCDENEARYDSGLCGACDVVHNDGNGELVGATRLTPAVIDKCLANAADVANEVEKQLKPCTGIPASLRGLRIGGTEES